MKKIQNLLRVLIVVMFVSMAYTMEAQPPTPPNGNNSGNSQHGTGGGAPIEGGLFILLGLGVTYGSRKVYKLTKEDEK